MQYRRLIFALLSSLLLSGSASVNAQTAAAKDADKWEPAMKAFEQADQTNAPPKDAVLFIGSSSIRAWRTLAKDFPEHKVINRGFGGSEIADSVRYADRILVPHRPKTVVLYAGDNDLAKGKTPQQLLGDFKEFVSTVHKELPKTKIVFIAVKPSPSRWALKDKVIESNTLIKRFCDSDSRLSYADIYTPMLGLDGLPREELFIQDKLHLSKEGYQLWTAVVKPHLKAGHSAPVSKR
ncbi:MAG: hypothetical protein H0X66_04375 [Verrucomicrobia bacterium]|nr:hypothetical protein [Verrucomicrobiota bacterium]